MTSIYDDYKPVKIRVDLFEDVESEPTDSEELSKALLTAIDVVGKEVGNALKPIENISKELSAVLEPAINNIGKEIGNILIPVIEGINGTIEQNRKDNENIKKSISDAVNESIKNNTEVNKSISDIVKKFQQSIIESVIKSQNEILGQTNKSNSEIIKDITKVVQGNKQQPIKINDWTTIECIPKRDKYGELERVLITRH